MKMKEKRNNDPPPPIYGKNLVEELVRMVMNAVSVGELTD